MRSTQISPTVLSGSALGKELVREKPYCSFLFKYIPQYY